MIFHRRKKIEQFRTFFRTFWAHRLFFQADFASFGQKYEKMFENFRFFSPAKYHPRLVEKPYGGSRGRPLRIRPGFWSQNVE